MNITDFKTLLDYPLYIQSFHDYGSWRGEPFEPAIFFDSDDDFIPISELKKPLDELMSGKEFEGYKGDYFDFSLDYSNEIHFEYDQSYIEDLPITEFLSPESIKYLKENNII